MDSLGHIAAIRFGLGLRLEETPPADPVAWLLSQLDRPAPPPTGPSQSETLQVQYAERVARRAVNPVGNPVEALADLRALGQAAQTDFATRRLASSEPFRDRLVDFWMNHFSVSRRHGGAAPLIGSYEREAIRPHVTGRFADMLLAVARHAAMLVYLDNPNSVGPGSRTGLRGRRGLNENLAREMLELHTLSPAGAFTQGDVQELAKILTGWSVSGDRSPWGFLFRVASHEPGEKFLLGRTIAAGEAGGDAALRLIASHPATWRHLAVKLARHFVADDPPPDAVRSLAAVLRDTDGDLGATSRALVMLPQAWSTPLGKFRAPQDYVIAACRALGVPPDQPNLLLGGLSALSQPVWMAPQPNGWADTAAEWATPEALLRRVDWAYTITGRFSRQAVGAVAEAALGPLAREATVREIRRAGSMRDALTLLLASPEFMHR